MVQPPSIYVAAGLEQIVYAYDLSAVDILDVLETAYVTFLCSGIGSLLRDNDIETAEESVSRGVTAAAVGLPSCDHDGIDSELSEDKVKRSAEECAVGLLRDDDVAFLRLELVDDLGAGSTLYSVRAPYLELLVNLRGVAVVGINYRETFSTGLLTELLDRLDDVINSRGSNRARYEVIEHVNDDYSILFHLSFYIKNNELSYGPQRY